MNRTNRIIAAVTLAVQRNPAMIDGSSGMFELRINVKFDADGKPCRVFVCPQFETFVVSKSIDGFTFPST